MRYKSASCTISLVALLSTAACGGGGGGGSSLPPSSPLPTTTSTPGTPVTPSTTSGIAFLPDVFTSSVPGNVQVIQYEDTQGNVLANPVSTNVSTSLLVGQIATDAKADESLILNSSTGFGFDQVQNVTVTNGAFGVLPTGAAIAGAGKLTSVAIAPGGGFAVIQGDNAGNATFALTNLSAAPAVFATPSPQRPGPASFDSKQAVAISPDGKSLVARGSDTTYYAITATGNAASPATFAQTADLTDNNALGSAMRGRGDMAFDPIDGSRLVLGGFPLGGQLALMTGLPGTVTQGASLTTPLPGIVSSIAFTPDGNYVVVGSNGGGLYIVSGVASGALAFVAQGAASNYSGTFLASDGSTQSVKNISSVGVSSDGKYVDAVVTYGIGQSGAPESALLVMPITSSGTLGTIVVAKKLTHPKLSQGPNDVDLFR